jgi:membrane protein DedA with SNARE-associated domain
MVIADVAMSTLGAIFAITDWVIALMEALGGPGAGLAIAIENLFPPIPSEMVLPLAGFTASQGKVSLVSVLVWTTAGSLVGALALYGLGRWLGLKRIRKIADRIPLMKPDDVDHTEAWFKRHGSKAVFFGRMIPFFRSLISIPAGVHEMAMPKFALLTVGGSAIWNSALVLAGYFLGERWSVVERYAGVFETIVGVLIVLALVWFIAKRVRAMRSAKTRS